jgi:chromosomal replication initiator protein
MPGIDADGVVETTNIAEKWVRILDRLRVEAGDVEFRTWLRQMTLGGVDGDEVSVCLPTRFLRDWVSTRYGTRLTALWQAEDPCIRRCELRVGGNAEQAMETITESDAVIDIEEPADMTPATVAPIDLKSDLTAALDARFTFDAFVVGKPNEFAHACAQRVAQQPSAHGFNPLFLYGGVGLGKTHLMHAIAWELTKRNETPGQAPIAFTYMSAEKFMYRFIAAIRSHSTMEFKEQLRNVDVLMIDDLQFLIGKDNTQEEFFHTFNYLVEAGKQIVVSSDKSPSDLALEDRLKTRLGCGMVADLHTTTYELRLSILQTKAIRAGGAVPVKVLEYLAHKITTNIRELEGALNRLIAHANLFGRAVTLESTHEVLHDLLKAHDRRVSVDEIQKRVAEYYAIRVSDMASARRARQVARPRQVAMYLAKQLTSRSLPEIGKKFGNRDHTTVMHAISRVNELMERDGTFAEDVALLRRLLES